MACSCLFCFSSRVFTGKMCIRDRSDITRYEFQLQNLELGLTSTGNRIKILNRHLTTTIGLAPETVILPDTTVLARNIERRDELSWQGMKNESPRLKLADLGVEMSKKQQDLVRAGRRPNKMCIRDRALPTYIDPATGKIHTHFNQAEAATGRLSSLNPNLQNIPIRTAEGRNIRKAFITGDPDYGFFSADYSQVELRLMAHLSGTPELINAFLKGEDVHAATASKIYLSLIHI